MASILANTLGLRLSAVEVRNLTGWTEDAIIEDYLNKQDVIDAVADPESGAILKLDFTPANTILKADVDKTPTPLVINENTLVGRQTGDVIADLSASQARAVLGLAITDSPTFAGLTLTGNLDLTNNNLNNVKAILFDITNLKTVHVEGQMRWNSDEGVPEVDLPGGQVTGQIFEEMLIRGKNQTGIADPDGKPVYISGASGSNPEFSLSDSDNAAADDLVALFTENVGTGANGFVTTFGKVRGFDTTGTPFGEVWAVGNRIYVATTPGDLTNVIPASNERKMCIGHVLRAHATEGVIFVNPLLTPFLTELSGVSNSAPTDKLLFGYNATNSLWEQTPQLFYNYATDRLGIGISPDEKLTVMQDADNNGFIIYGFDDESDEFIQLSINSTGNAVYTASRNVFYNTNLGIFDDKFINFGTSIDYRMEYDAGTSQFQFETLDNDGVGTNGIVWLINDGTDDVIFKGRISSGDVVPLAMGHFKAESATDIGQIIEMAASPSADALRIQEGAAILTRINAAGDMGIGIDPTDPLHAIGSMTLAEDATAANPGKVFYFQSSGSSMGTCELNSDGTGGAAIEFAKSRGTNSAKTIIQDGNVMGGFLGSGYDGFNFIQSAGIRFRVDGTPGTTDMPGEITFETTPDGGSSRVINAILKANGFFGINVDPPLAVLDVNGDTRLGDSTTNYVEIESGGDVNFVGGAGLQFGEIWVQDQITPTTFADPGKANKVQVDIFDTNGHSNGSVTPDHTNDHITIGKAGMYMVTISACVSSTGGDSDTIGFSLYKNNGATEFANVHCHRLFSGGAGDKGALQLSGIIDGTAADTLEVWCWNEDDTDSITIDDMTLTVIQIGGT